MSDDKPQSPEWPDLDPNSRDGFVSVAKAGASLVPIAGGFFAELIGEKVLGQRSERVVDFVRRLQAEFFDLKAAVAALHSSEDAADLALKGARLASEARSPERRERIARIVAGGMSANEQKASHASRMLRLADQLDDEQIAWLIAAKKDAKGLHRQFVGHANSREAQSFMVMDMRRLGLLDVHSDQQSDVDRILKARASGRDVGLAARPRPPELFLTDLAEQLLKAMGLTDQAS